MKVGTDGSLTECRQSGYPVIDFNAKKLCPQGLDKPIDKSVNVRLTVSDPDNWSNGRPLFKKKYQLYSCDKMINFEDVYSAYLREKDGIDKYADMKNCPIEMENPTYWDFLQLISVVQPYCGIN